MFGLSPNILSLLQFSLVFNPLWPSFVVLFLSHTVCSSEFILYFLDHYMWRNTLKSGGMRWEGSARNPTSRLTLPFLEQCYHFEILTSINTLTCFVSSSLGQLVKTKVYLYILCDLLEHIDLGQSKKLGTSQFAHLGFDYAWGFFAYFADVY